MAEARLAAPGTGVRPMLRGRSWPQGIVWLLFGVLALRFLALWTNAFAGTGFPLPGKIVVTLVWTAFAVLHAVTLLGRARALAFLVICIVLSWSFEAVGVMTGSVFGAYHYGDQLGPTLGAVPLIIPLAWFMMIYAAWIVARLLLHGTGDPSTLAASAARCLVAALAMTAWDTVMDPGMARAGAWTWEHGGAYFGVPLQNFAGWMATTLSVYATAELAMRRWPAPPPASALRVYPVLPAILYGLVALDAILLPGLPELRIVATFGMAFVALLALLRIGTARIV